MTNQTYGFINGQPIGPGEGWEIVPLHDIMPAGSQATLDGINWPIHDCAKWAPIEVLEANPGILAFRRPITKPALPFPIEDGFDYIVTEEDKVRFAPLQETDDVFLHHEQEWFRTANHSFSPELYYRRRKAKETNPASSAVTAEDHYVQRIHKAVHHMEIVELKHELTQLRAAIDDHVAKALITNHIIKLSAEEVTRLHSIIDAQAGESESLKLQNAGLHAEFMKMAQQIAVLGGDKASLQSTIDAQKKVIAEAEKAINEARLWMTNPIFTRALTAIRKLEEGK